MSEIAIPETTNELWHRQPGETAQAFNAFSVYRNLPPPRTVIGAARNYAETTRRNERTVHTQFHQWSRKFEWQDRADAYDLMLDRVRLQARETERMRIDREQMLEGRYLRSAAITRFTGGQDQQGNPVTGFNLNDLDINEALALYRTGVQTERQAAGLQIGRALGMVTVAEVRRIAQEIFEIAMDYIHEDNRPGFVQRIQTLGETGRR